MDVDMSAFHSSRSQTRSRARLAAQRRPALLETSTNGLKVGVCLHKRAFYVLLCEYVCMYVCVNLCECMCM